MLNRRRTRWEVAALLVLGLAAWTRALADGSGPIDPFPITGAYSAFHREDREHISVIEIAGNYDRNLSGGQINVEPRAVIAREFFRTHPDHYDFLVTFSTFEFSTGDAVAFHWAVQNKVQGIGIRPFDNSALFGSQGKLQGFIDMAALTRYKADPLDPGFETVLGTLAHEMLHQWGSFVKVRNPDGSLSDALLGRDNAHWSYLLDSNASVEYGADWRDNGDGSFSAVGTRKFFSPLDLYLMGFYKPEEVPPFFLIENPAIDKTQLPQENITITGNKRVVTINDVIAAEGPRVPAADQAQKDFRIGFILLAGPGQPVSDAQIAALNHIRNGFMTRFAILTAGRATAQVYPEALPVERPGTPAVVGGGDLRTTPASIEDGMAWLRGKQTSQGYWSDKQNTTVRDTVTSLSTLSQLDLTFNNAAPALTWLSQNAASNADYLARHAAALTELGSDASPVRATLAGLQNADGGWGIASGYRSDPLDTALAVLALANSGAASQTAIDRAAQYLLSKQSADGGWSNAEGGPSRTTVTTTVLRALRALGKHATVAPTALAWLGSKQNTDGGFGDSPSTVHDTATVLQTFMAFDAITQIRPDAAANYLFSRQTVEGSWEGSAYATATALAALKRFSFPNWAMTAFTAEPLSPLDGQRVKLGVTIKNDSNVIAQPGVLRIFDGDPASGGTVIGTDIQIPLLGPGASVSFAPLWDTFDKPGLHTLYAVADPDNTQTEMSERDNRISVKVTVLPAPPGIDLVVATPDVVISPSNPNTLPTTLGLTANVRNAGLTDARNVRILVWQGEPGTGTLVGETTLDILARSTVVANFSHALTAPGTVSFTVLVDPDNAIAEASEVNNTAVALVSTAPSVDLAVTNADITADKNPAYLGDDVTFRVTLRNRGTVDAPPAQVRYLITDGSTTRMLRTNTVDIGAGKSLEQTLTWRVDLTGSLTFTAQLDPDGLVPETDEGNNAGSVALVSGNAVGPNLAVSYQDFSFTPTPANEGRDLILSAVVRNTGTVAAGNFDVTFYNGDPLAGGIALGTVTVPGLAAGASSLVAFTWNAVPTPGDKLLYVAVDPANAIAEFNEGDNAAFNVATVISLPDLAISTGDIRITPAFPKAGDMITLSARVTNLGEQGAANFMVRAFDGDPASGGAQIGGDQVIALIAGNGEATVNFNLNFTASGGVRPIVVQVDPANAILERNKANNTARRDIAIQDGNFYVTELFFSPNGDSVKDATQFFFRLAATSNVTVEVVNKRDKVVRRFSGAALQGISAGNVTWDGLDDLGRLVVDGRYRLRVVDATGTAFGEVAVTLDTNRSSLLEAIGTRYESFSNLSCELRDISGFTLTEDESRIFFFTNSIQAQDPYRKGVYRMEGDGTDIRAIVSEPFFNTTTEVPGRNFPPYNAYITRITAAANGSRVALVRQDNWANKEAPLWVANADGTNLHRANIRPNFYGQIWMSPDGATVYTVGPEVSTEYYGSALLATAADGSGAPVKLLDGVAEYSIKFSPDGRKIAALATNGGSYNTLWIVDTQTRVAVQPLGVPTTSSSYEFVWSPNSARLGVIDAANNRIAVVDANGNTVRNITNPIAVGTDRYLDLGNITWSSNSAEFSFKSAVEYNTGAGGAGSALDPGGIYVADLTTGQADKVASFRLQIGCGEGCESYHISTWDGSRWTERGVLHYGMHYQEKELDLSAYAPSSGADFRVRIRQQGMEAAHVESVALLSGSARLMPVAALHLGTSQNVLDKVLYPDNEVLDLHNAEMEVRWQGVAPGNLRLALKAREEVLTGRKAIPFSYPAEPGRVYNHVIRGNQPMTVDGRQTAQDNLGERLFKVYSRPGTGHPAADVYGYVQSDDKFLYAALDFTVDNTEDQNKDWAALRVKTTSGWKEFRVTAVDNTHGVVGFLRTGAVHHTHKYYEFKVPLADLGAHSGDTLDIAFQAYGTAAIMLPDGEGPHSGGELYWVPGERSLLYRSYEYDGLRHTAVLLDEANQQRRLFDEWGGDFYLSKFSPTGRQLLFQSGRAAWDPTSTCYRQGNTDDWSFRSLLNLTADLRAIRSASGGVRLEGTAADLNFASYALDYTEASAPSDWRPVQPASNEPVVDQRFTMWVPPGPGTYFVRLTSTDLAGNVRQNIKRVAWADTPSITDVYRLPAFISPNGDGVQDEATIHYRVLEPVHLDFNFYNKAGDRVRTIVRDHSAVGAEFNLVWDGRDDRGLPVPDGVYRMTVQNYEFFVTVDATLPATTLRLNAAYQKIEVSYIDPDTGLLVNKNIVSVQPSLDWSVAEVNYADSAIETGTGVNPGAWAVFEDIDPRERGVGEPQRRYLGVHEFTNQRFRVVAADRAGNNTIESTALGAEQLIVAEFGNLGVNPVIKKAYDQGLLSTPGAIEKSVQMNGPYRIIGPVRYVPMGQDDGGNILSATVAPNEVRLNIAETIRAEILQLYAQFREPNSSAWREAPIKDFLNGRLSIPNNSLVVDKTNLVGQHLPQAVWDLAGLEPGKTYVTRLRAVDATGKEHLSNTFRFAIGGYSFNGLIFENSSEPRWNQLVSPLVKRPILDGEYFLWGQELLAPPIAEVQLYVQSKEDARYPTYRHLASTAYPDGTYVFRTQDLAACKKYTGYVVLLGEAGPDGIRAELGRTTPIPFEAPCLKLTSEVKVQHAASCGDPSPNRIAIDFKMFSLDGTELKLLTLARQNPVTGEDIVFNVNKPDPKQSYSYLLDTSSLPEGSIPYKARLINVNDVETVNNINIIVDHTTPVQSIDYPLDGQRVCATPITGVDGKVRNVLTLEGQIRDANGFHYEVDIGAGDNPDQFSTFHISRSKNSLRAANGEKDVVYPFDEHHIVNPLQGPLAALIDENGTRTARLRVFDMGGYQQCSTRSFTVDGLVEVRPSRADRLLFSPNGDGVLDDVTLTYGADEAVTLDVDIHAAVAISIGDYEITGPVLRRLISQRQILAGEETVVWEGRGDGGNVLADGLYGIVFTHRDSCGNLQKTRVFVTIDNTPPAVAIAYPKTGDPLPMMVEVQGSVNDPHLQGYSIDFGIGAVPETWAILATSARNDTDKVLATWNTYGLEGAHVLRVVASDRVGNQTITLIPLTLISRTNLISYLEAVPAIFSPNGDGRRESTAVRFALEQPSVVTLAVMDSGGTVLRTLVSGQTMSKGAASVNWDGRNAQGVIVPDGQYTVGLLAALESNTLLKQDEKITVTVDSTTPVIAIARPANGFVPATGGIVGNVTDRHLTTYTAWLTDTPRAPAWIEINTGTSSRSDFTFGSLAGRAEGEYALRIEAKDEAENAAETLVPFIIDNTPPKVELTAPETGAYVGIKKSPVSIKGTITEKYLKTYQLEFGAGADPASWTVLAIGTNLPLPDVLKAWDVSGIADGLYTLRLVSEDKAGLRGEMRITLTVDNTPPTAAVTTPAENGYVKQPLDVLGTATDANLAGYKLEIAPGVKGASTRWSELGAGSVAVNNAALLAWQALPSDGVHTLRLTVRDKAENTAEVLVQVNVDTHPPATPLGLKATVENRQDVHLTWQTNSETDVAGYAVYRDGARITPDLLPTPAYIDRAVAEGKYQYSVTAWDRAGWESQRSDPAAAVIDISPPTARIQAPGNVSTVSGLQDVKGTAYSVDDFKEYRLYVAPASDPTSLQLLRRSPVPILADLLSQWNTVALTEGVQYLLKLEAEDINGNIGIDQVNVTIDNLPPAAPTGLVAAATGSNVQLTWNPNTETDLYGYLVFRGVRLANAKGTVVGELKPYAVVTTQYPDLSLPDGPYTYTIIAVDRAGNLSGPSTPASVVIDIRPPHAVIVQPVAGAKFDTPLYVLATSEDTDVAQVQFQYRVAGGVWTNLGAADTSLPYEAILDPAVLRLSYGSYQLQAIATDTNNKVDPSPTPVAVTYIDITRPALTLGLTNKVNGGDVTLTWTANTDTDLAGYHIDRLGAQGTQVRLTTTPLIGTTHLDSNLTDGSYVYTVTAIDAAGNQADPSAASPAIVYTPVLKQPYTPTKDASTTLTGVGLGTATVSGEVVNAAGSTPIASLVADAQGRFTQASLALAVGGNAINVRMTDAAGNVSKTATATVTVGNSPSQPTGLTASAAGYNVSLGWNANPEANILGYRMFRNNVALLPDMPMTDLAASASSIWDAPAVGAVDFNMLSYWSPATYNQPSAGQWLAVSWPQLRVVTQAVVEWADETNRAVDYDIEAWTGIAWVTVSEVRANTSARNEITLTIPYRTTQMRLVLRKLANPDNDYQPVRLSEFGLFHQSYELTTTHTDISPDGNHQYTVTAVNAYGFESVPSAPSGLAVGDVLPPEPVLLTAGVAGSDVTLTWSASASTDVARYLVYRDGSLIATHTDLANLAYLDAGRPNGTYIYVVKAVDGANNESAASNEAPATVVIALPPAPLNLVVATVSEGGALDLAWTPGAGLNPAGYRILRSSTAGGPFAPVGESTVTARRDSGLNNGTTYFYVVIALDALGNASSYSNEASGTPLDQVAPAATLFYPTLPGKLYVTGEPFATVVGTTEAGATVSLSANGSRVRNAQALAANQVVERPLSTWDSSVSLSPDGRYAVYVSDERALTWYDLTTKNSRVIAVISHYNDVNAHWSPDGREIVFTDRDPNYYEYYIRAYRLADQTLRDLSDPATGSLYAGRLSPDGKRLAAVGNYDGTAGLGYLELGSGVWTPLVNASNWMFDGRSLRWSPDGGRIAYLRTYPAPSIEVVNVGSGAVQVLEAQAGYGAPSWSPDGTALLYTSRRNGSEQVWRYTYTDGTARAVTTDINYSYLNPIWSADGDAILYVFDYGRVDRLDLATGSVTTLTTATNYVESQTLHVVDAGYVAVLIDDKLQRIAPAGRFEIQGVTLAPGDNVLSATATDLSGNTGAPSAAIVLNYKVGDRADLAVADADVRVIPSSPLLGETARATVIVRNVGTLASPRATMSLLAIGPLGDVTTLTEGALLNPIAANAAQTVSADWTVSGGAGEYQLVAVIDPLNEIAEVSEVNNLAVRAVRVAGNTRPQISVTTDKTAYSPAETVAASITVENSGDIFTGRVELAIEDQGGYLVAKILNGVLREYAYAARSTESGVWNSSTSFAGAYQAHARLFGADGLLVSEATAPFTLGAVANLTSQLLTDKAVYIANSDVAVTGTLTYDLGNTVISGAESVLRIVDSNNVTLAERRETLGDLLPAAVNTLTLSWNTSNSAVGQYRAMLAVTKAGQTLTSATAQFAIEAGTTQISGSLNLSEQAPAPGTGQIASYHVRNLGNAAVSQLPVLVSLVDPTLQTTLETQRFNHDLGTGGEVSGTALFATAGLVLKTYTVVLQAELTEATGTRLVTLATVGFPVVDRTPPNVSLRQPGENGYIRGDGKATVYAIDQLSSVKTVEISVDGAPWIVAPVNNPAESLYGDLLRGLPEGVHTIQARATDVWSNTGSTTIATFIVDNTPPAIVIGDVLDGAIYNTDRAPTIAVTDLNLAASFISLNGAAFVSGTAITADGDYTIAANATDKAGNNSQRQARFTLDKTPPQITVTGVADNASYNIDVTPVILVTDEHLQSQSVTLNGQPYVTGAVVVAEGSFELVVNAVDSAGNQSTRTLHFVIDKTPPLVTIASPLNNAVVSIRHIEVRGSTESLAAVYLAVGSYVASGFADTQGLFSFANVPLAEGANTIEVYAIDRAGNKGPNVNVQVRVRTIELKGEIVHGGRVLAWIPSGRACEGEHEQEGSECPDDRNNSSAPKNTSNASSVDMGNNERLVALVDATLRREAEDYLIVRTEEEFLKAVRTRRYTTLLLSELHNGQSSGHEGDEHDEHGDGESGLHMRESTRHEIRGTVASGVGIVWIKTHPDANEHWADMFGVVKKGVIPKLTRVELGDSPASVAGSWQTNGMGMKYEVLRGSPVGRLFGDGEYPSMVIGRYGQGQTALVAFDPSQFTDPQGAIETLANVVRYAAPVDLALVPGAITGVRWTASQLPAPIDVRLVETLPLTMKFVAVSEGVINSPQEATWERSVTLPETVFSGLVRLPTSIGAYEIKAGLFERTVGAPGLLIEGVLTVNVPAGRDELAVEAMMTLATLNVSGLDQRKLAKATELLQAVVIRPQLTRADADYSITQIGEVIEALSEMSIDMTVVIAKVGLLLGSYQVLWASYP